MAVRRMGKTPFDYVGASPMVGMQLATEHLISLGHEKIGFIGGYQKTSLILSVMLDLPPQ